MAAYQPCQNANRYGMLQHQARGKLGQCHASRVAFERAVPLQCVSDLLLLVQRERASRWCAKGCKCCADGESKGLPHAVDSGGIPTVILNQGLRTLYAVQHLVNF